MSDAAGQTGLRGASGAGGLFAVWPRGREAPDAAASIAFQYSGMAHQADAGLSGMWLFLATELLFFGSLFLIAAVVWERYAPSIRLASHHASFAIGTINTIVLLASSAIFTWGVYRGRDGDNRGVMIAAVLTMSLGLAFLALKGVEWHDDFTKGLLPGPDFSIAGPARGPAEIFWSFYFLATFLHGLHMIAGVVLMGWVAMGARRRRFSANYATPVEAVGLYWSFVDMMWLCLYPLIYLPGVAVR